TNQVGKCSPTSDQDSPPAETRFLTTLVVKKRQEPARQLGPVKQAAPHLDHREVEGSSRQVCRDHRHLASLHISQYIIMFHDEREQGAGTTRGGGRASPGFGKADDQT